MTTFISGYILIINNNIFKMLLLDHNVHVVSELAFQLKKRDDEMMKIYSMTFSDLF